MSSKPTTSKHGRDHSKFTKANSAIVVQTNRSISIESCITRIYAIIEELTRCTTREEATNQK